LVPIGYSLLARDTVALSLALVKQTHARATNSAFTVVLAVVGLIPAN
jgi:hypothetical protein